MSAENTTAVVDTSYNPAIGFAYTTLVIMAALPIYIGSYLSLNRRKGVESMKAKDAYMFPFIAGGFLVGLYLLFKFINKDYVNLLLNIYLLAFGFFALVATLHVLIEEVYSIFASPENLTRFKFTIPLAKIKVDATILDALGALVGTLLVAWYMLTKHWIACNLLGLAFAIQGIAVIALPTYRVGAVLLGGLFVYDVFFVFATDVMVTVAKSFDAPIKLLIPKDIWAPTYNFSMLGLGDIVLPGVFLALLLRYDAFRAGKKTGFPSPYFTIGFLSYILGLFFTMYIMHTFQAAQPALLYLVPACLGSSALTALWKGDMKGLLNYSEEDPTKDGEIKSNTISDKARYVVSKLKKM